jgi:MFS family permease
VSAPDKRLSAIPGGIWAIGFVSMFMDISSEMIHSLLPVFLVTALGASVGLVGIIEGVGEATASISKLFSGWLSDRLGNRKMLAALGYGLGALSKPFFALAPTAGWVLAARFSDRVGKGVRGAPRDALVGDLAPPAHRGAAYGLRQTLDTIGSFAGPLLAMLFMALFRDDFRRVFWLAIVPGVLSVVVLLLFVKEPPQRAPVRNAPFPIRWSQLRLFGPAYWSVVAVGALLTLARFSEAFLVLRAQNVGLPLALIPLVLVVMNVVYALSAYPMGVLSDRISRTGLLAAGFAVLLAAVLVLAFAPGLAVVALGIVLWGLHMGITQGLLATLVADTAPTELRGTAFGLFNFVGGIAVLLASVIAGALWTAFGPAATFLAGAAFTLAGSVALLLRRPATAPKE